MDCTRVLEGNLPKFIPFLIIFAQSISGMLFKYPELLWALFLLLIPIFIHLFQLRRFKKTPFTNVKLLKKIVSESRRSNTLKRWLLLMTRLSLFAALIIAFAQPYLAKESALQEKETVIYLDDSFSMQAKLNGGTLLSHAVQELLKWIPENETFSLFTNTETFTEVGPRDIQNRLLSLETSPRQLSLKDIDLKAEALFSDNSTTVKNLLMFSDFQERMSKQLPDSINNFQRHPVQLSPQTRGNVALDSVFINSGDTEHPELTVQLSTSGAIESVPVSLYDGNKLISKTAAVFADGKGEVVFTIQRDGAFRGRLEIMDAGLNYDNQLYFTIDDKERPKVLAIGSADHGFLKRIYTENDFIFSSTPLKDLSYSEIDTHNLVILNELETIPASPHNGLDDLCFQRRGFEHHSLGQPGNGKL